MTPYIWALGTLLASPLPQPWSLILCCPLPRLLHSFQLLGWYQLRWLTDTSFIGNYSGYRKLPCPKLHALPGSAYGQGLTEARMQMPSLLGSIWKSSKELCQPQSLRASFPNHQTRSTHLVGLIRLWRRHIHTWEHYSPIYHLTQKAASFVWEGPRAGRGSNHVQAALPRALYDPAGWTELMHL